MFGLTCNKGHHLKGTSPVAQARESLGREPSCYSARGGRGRIQDHGVLLRGIVLLGHSDRSSCFSGTLLDLALTSLGILALGARRLLRVAAWVIRLAEIIASKGPLLWITACITPALPVLCLQLFGDVWSAS